MAELLFIIGVGRSGTTLLQSLLHSHTSIHFIPETHFVKKYLSKEVHGKSGANVRRHLLNNISDDKALNNVSKNLKEICQKASSIKDQEYITSWVFNQLLMENSDDASYLGDKDPMNVYYLDVIKTAFPNAKILQIIRDPRDVISSRMKSDWGKKASMASHIAEYIYGLKKSRKEGRYYFKDNYFELNYEELIRNPESLLKEVCDFLNVSFETSMLNHQKKSNELLRNDEGEWKSNVLKPIMSNNSEKWKEALSEDQLRAIEFSMQNVFKETGYTIQSTSFGISERIYNILVEIYLFAFRIRFN